MKPLVALALAAIACVSVQARSASAAGTDRAQIIATEHHWLDAIRRHDRRALEAILADRFLDINANGELRDRQEAIAHASAPDATQTITQLEVRVFGDTAIATGINTVHSLAKGWTVEIAFTDVFIRERGDRWRAVSAQETLRKPGAG